MQVVEFGGALPFRARRPLRRRLPAQLLVRVGRRLDGVLDARARAVGAGIDAAARHRGGGGVRSGAGLLRIAFGGHFLSDTILSALLTWLVIIATWRIVIGRRAASDAPAGSLPEDLPS